MKPKLEVAPKPRSQIIGHERLKQGIKPSLQDSRVQQPSMALPNVPIFPLMEKLDRKMAKKPMKQQSKYHTLIFVFGKCFSKKLLEQK
jgi:hypothetical protein